MQGCWDADWQGCWDARMLGRRDAGAWLERPDGAGNCNSRGWAQVLDSVGSSRRGMTMVRVEVRVAIFLV